MTTSTEHSPSPNETSTRTIQVQYYAQMREDAGRAEERVETEAASVSELFAELNQRYRFSLSPDALRVAVNSEFAGWDTSLESNDLVVFIPPVAGG